MIELHQPYWKNLVNMLGGDSDTYLIPLRIPVIGIDWPSLCNPSVFVDDGKIRLIIRNVDYILHNSISPYRCWSSWGPVHYLTPEWDNHLRTRNFLCECTKKSLTYNLIDTTENDKEPLWDFVGQEDARLVRWDGHLYAIGVRRDDNKTGVGRMEIMEIDENGKEIERTKIEIPWDGYCEKNWVPIIDMPYHFMRTSNPVCIMKIDIETRTDGVVMAQEVVRKEYIDVSNVPGIYNAHWQGETLFRGSSQVIPYKKDKHIALVHTCELYLNELGKKVARYLHHFIVWDKDWNIEKISPSFSFNDYNIEFSDGMAYKDGMFYVTFALQDNIAYLIKFSEKNLDKIVNGSFDLTENQEFLPNATWYYDNYDGFERMEQETSFCVKFGYFQEAYTRYWRMYERSFLFPISKEKRISYLIGILNSLGWGHRDKEVYNVISLLEEEDPENPEVLMRIAEFFHKNNPSMARVYAIRSQKSMPRDYNFSIYTETQYHEIFKNIMKDRWDTCMDYNIQDNFKEIEHVL